MSAVMIVREYGCRGWMIGASSQPDRLGLITETIFYTAGKIARGKCSKSDLRLKTEF